MEGEVKINSNQMVEDQPHSFVAFASDLELPPGKIPAVFETDVGNGRPFVLDPSSNSYAIRYLQEQGRAELMLFND